MMDQYTLWQGYNNNLGQGSCSKEALVERNKLVGYNMAMVDMADMAKQEGQLVGLG